MTDRVAVRMAAHTIAARDRQGFWPSRWPVSAQSGAGDCSGQASSAEVADPALMSDEGQECGVTLRPEPAAGRAPSHARPDWTQELHYSQRVKTFGATGYSIGPAFLIPQMTHGHT